MNLAYTKISKELYKFFYEDDGYGEFYIRFDNDPVEVNGSASIEYKDKDYGPDLIKALTTELCGSSEQDKLLKDIIDTTARLKKLEKRFMDEKKAEAYDNE